MLVRTHPLATLLLIGALLLTGCSTEEPEPKIAEAPSVASTPEKKETAEEFIRRWAEVERDMQNSGETADYRGITSGCEPCTSLADDMDDVYGAKGWVRTDGMSIAHVEKQPNRTFKVVADISPTTYLTAEDGTEGSFTGGSVIYLVTLHRVSGEWQLVNLMKQPSS